VELIAIKRNAIFKLPSVLKIDFAIPKLERKKDSLSKLASACPHPT
jgi:hypothetical protein